MVHSMQFGETVSTTFMSVVLDPSHGAAWIRGMKQWLGLCLDAATSEHGMVPGRDDRHLAAVLHVLVTFTSTQSWCSPEVTSSPILVKLCDMFLAHLCRDGGLYTRFGEMLKRHGANLGHPQLLAVVTLTLRGLGLDAAREQNMLAQFVVHVLCVPVFVHRIQETSPEMLRLMAKKRVISRSLGLLAACDGSSDRVFAQVRTCGSNAFISLLGNVIHLVHTTLGNSEDNPGLLDAPDFRCNVVTCVVRLLDECVKDDQSESSGPGKLSLSVWNPILGWSSGPITRGSHETLPLVLTQLERLWSLPILNFVFEELRLRDPVMDGDDRIYELSVSTTSASSSAVWSVSGIRQLLFNSGSSAASGQQPTTSLSQVLQPQGDLSSWKLDGSEVAPVTSAAHMYNSALRVLRQHRIGILSGLCVMNGSLVAGMWRRLFRKLGHGIGGLGQWLDLLSGKSKPKSSWHLLALFCDASAHLLTILDEDELYEKQKPFRQDELVAIAAFVNRLVFQAVYSSSADDRETAGLPQSVLALLSVMYQRDARRKFCPSGHWLVPEACTSSFLTDVDKMRTRAKRVMQIIPHVVPHTHRIVLFRDLVSRDKSAGTCTAATSCTLITVRRGYLVEDGYRQLAGLSGAQLKGPVRVKFVNVQGLDEAGIDQDGVFKEFLEETVKRVFDPQMNLFRATADGCLYPSPTARLTAGEAECDHLFEFVGKMLGKAVYEGIVLDVKFAQFFLSQVVSSALGTYAAYSCLDELPSLDPELYKSLIFIKHYDGDVSQLELTFTCDEDVLGQIVTHELVEGGRMVSVQDDNRILYVHRMAEWRVRRQLHAQVTAFRRGFCSLIRPDWLALFSTTADVQRLLSGGDTSDK
ncbi:unnamed protein product, partial [Notodromas monacha]